VGGGVFNEISLVERIDTGLDLPRSAFSFSASSRRRCWSTRSASRTASLAF
jgi:hypothetical protein